MSWEWERKCYILGFESFLSESHAHTLCYTRGAQDFKDQIRWINLKQGKEILGKRFDFHLTISQKHRGVEVGKALQRSAGPTPLLRQSHLEPKQQNKTLYSFQGTFLEPSSKAEKIKYTLLFFFPVFH